MKSRLLFLDDCEWRVCYMCILVRWSKAVSLHLPRSQALDLNRGFVDLPSTTSGISFRHLSFQCTNEWCGGPGRITVYHDRSNCAGTGIEYSGRKRNGNIRMWREIPRIWPWHSCWWPTSWGGSSRNEIFLERGHKFPEITGTNLGARMEKNIFVFVCF